MNWPEIEPGSSQTTATNRLNYDTTLGSTAQYLVLNYGPIE